MSTSVLDVDLALGRRDLEGLGPYPQTLVLLRWRGRPLGRMRLTVDRGHIPGAALWAAAEAACGSALTRARVEELLPSAEPVSLALPSATVVICTRDRTAELARCLARLRAVCTPDVPVLVVDNAPGDDATAELACRVGVAYVREPRPGLGWARARGVAVASSELVLFTDDDVVVDAGWVDGLRRPFLNPDVVAASGLVLPAELETDAQELFEVLYGTARGFEPRELTALTLPPLAAGSIVAGASMAVRRRLAEALGLFAVELGAGTIAEAGEDSYAFYRLLARGYRVAYAPEAVVWHHHGRDLAVQLRGYSLGVMCFLLRCLVDHGEGDAVGSMWWWLRSYVLPHLWSALARRPGAPPLAIALAEVRGVIAAPRAYLTSRRRERLAARP